MFHSLLFSLSYKPKNEKANVSVDDSVADHKFNFICQLSFFRLSSIAIVALANFFLLSVSEWGR